ncbi:MULTISPECIES: PAS domain S-box protein [Bradyrhizobium]|nr:MULTISPECIES: PAS domain S-box protein [Bradyrhizobium]MDU0957369.1 PAS domain S-box protein [Bradyrhizobium sp.]MDU1491312.1 PAS domain S-box protein [Bradyrhizobium sp.]MDU1541490.1 PAS domain S-box protein [Bradyrhizobium sp.]MDU1803500.1 PAS domain S-box protein [Bradyrhizobium sp.]MDU3040010.1 PAS domain S-box protein [Bradyrhizobium sp.]
MTALELAGLIATGALLLVLAAAVGALAFRAVERTRYEAALQKSEQRFRQVVEHSPNAKVLVGTDGRIHLVNAQTEALFGWSRQELLGEAVEMLVPERFRSGHPHHRSAFLQQPVSRPMGAGRDLYGLRKDGSEFPIEIGLNPIETDEGLFILSAIIDISDRKQIEERLERLVEARTAELQDQIEQRRRAEDTLRQSQKMDAIGKLTGGVAHDFNNMLAIVIGSLDIALRRLATEPEKATACIENAQEGARRAAILTARLLAFSRQQPLEPESVDANKLVGGMSEMLRRTIGEDLRVEAVLAGGLWRTYADASQLENALLNLCVNARDAMPDGGRLTIETSNTHLDEAYAGQHAEVTAGQYVLIAVTDTGTGMPPEVIERAFDPFYTTKGAGRGTGLGLSQVYGFVKQSGGHVKIYSEPGQGTTVKIYLPRFMGQASSSPVRGSTEPRPAGMVNEIILVVEDEAGVRHMSVDALRELGYTVIQAENAAQALQLLDLQPSVSLLFTDIVMPDMNGRRLADEALERRPDLKILFTTGYTRNAVIHNGTLDPGVAFLPKPFSLDALARKVRQVLDGNGANRPRGHRS